MNDFNQGLLSFLKQSTSPFHAVQTMSTRLLDAGFERLDERAQWSLVAGGRYFLTRNDSSIIAFVQGGGDIADTGIRMLGAHTDSPCLKVKPKPELVRHGYFQLGVEVYGGVLLNPWFDRDLSLSGRVTYRSKAGTLGSALLDFETAIATIPSLAIHLDREANSKRAINAQKHIPPILMQADSTEQTDFRELLKAQLLKEQPELELDAVLDYEMGFYDVQAPAQIGLAGDFIASARLDNLLSCYIELEALIAVAKGDTPAHTQLLTCNDHEEVGSASACGAQGPMLAQLLERLVPDSEARSRSIQNSMMISVDNAHGIHPNYSDRHDGNHGPILNQGPVIKINANQRYASNSETSALFRHLCEQEEVPVQAFVARTDMGCGSTIGPITAAEVGVKTLDVGVPTFGMHSIRELAGAKDSEYLYKVLLAYLSLKSVAIA